MPCIIVGPFLTHCMSPIYIQVRRRCWSKQSVHPSNPSIMSCQPDATEKFKRFALGLRYFIIIGLRRMEWNGITSARLDSIPFSASCCMLPSMITSPTYTMHLSLRSNLSAIVHWKNAFAFGIPFCVHPGRQNSINRSCSSSATDICQ